MLLCLDTESQAEGTHMRNYRRSEIILVRVTRLHVLGVNSSASVAIGARATSTPRRTCDTSAMCHTCDFLPWPDLTLAHVRHLDSDSYDSWKQESQIPSTHVCPLVSPPGRATGQVPYQDLRVSLRSRLPHTYSQQSGMRGY